MIASLQGKVEATFADHIVLNVGGIGYLVYTPFSTLERIKGDEIFLHTLMVVREDSISLYGFYTTMERELFETLLKVNGVGPRLALAILSNMSIDNVRNAVISERAEMFMRVPGIGKKTAQKIALELKDKLPVGLEDAPVSAFDEVNSDVMDALVSLGYSIIEAQTAIQALPHDAPKDVEARIRLALQYFA